VSALAPTLEAFFTERLVGQRQVSPHTVAAYADTFRLLLAFVQRQSGKAPARLSLTDLDAPVIGAFSITSSGSGATLCEPETHAWPPSIRCFGSLGCVTPSTLH
jgi:site-specific recombinase XerC